MGSLAQALPYSDELDAFEVPTQIREAARRGTGSAHVGISKGVDTPRSNLTIAPVGNAGEKVRTEKDRTGPAVAGSPGVHGSASAPSTLLQRRQSITDSVNESLVPLENTLSMSNHNIVPKTSGEYTRVATPGPEAASALEASGFGRRASNTPSQIAEADALQGPVGTIIIDW